MWKIFSCVLEQLEVAFNNVISITLTLDPSVWWESEALAHPGSGMKGQFNPWVFYCFCSQVKRLWNDATLNDPTFWGMLTMSLHFWDCSLFNCWWFVIASTRAFTQWTAWLIRFPLDASDDYFKTLVATSSCWSFIWLNMNCCT